MVDDVDDVLNFATCLSVDRFEDESHLRLSRRSRSVDGSSNTLQYQCIVFEEENVQLKKYLRLEIV
jgi:hypothetical protein